MVPSLRVTLSLRGRCEGLDRALDASVGWYAEPGWRRAFEAAGLDEKTETTPLTVDTGTTLDLAPDTADHPTPELWDDETKPPARYRAHTLVKAMKEAGIGRPSTYAKTVDRLKERGYVTTEESTVVPTESGRKIWQEAAPLFCLPDERGVFQTEYTAAMEALLDDVAEGRRNASAVWKTMLDEFKSAHATAQEASKTGSLVPRTRGKLQEYMEAAPELAEEIGELDALTEQHAKALLAELRTRNITLLPSKKQQRYLEKLLETTGLTLAKAVKSADLLLAGEAPNRAEATALIDHLKALQAQKRLPSARQLRWIADLAGKAGLDEAGACAMVGLGSYAELTGEKGGTASALIDALRTRQKDGVALK